MQGSKCMLQEKFCKYLSTADFAIHHKNSYSYSDSARQGLVSPS
jgi:hypothetical protein